MRLKVRGGTAAGGQPTLCLTCRFATVVRGRALNDEIIECYRLSEGTRIPFTVTSCTAYSDRRYASLRDLEDIAWVLRSDPRKNVIGFVKASELEEVVVEVASDQKGV